MQTARPGNPSDLYRNILSQVLNVKDKTERANENPSTAHPTQTGSPEGSFALCRNILSQVLNVKSETCPNGRAESQRFPFSAFLSTGRTCLYIR